MRLRSLIVPLVCSFSCSAFSQELQTSAPKFWITGEAAAVWQSRNQVEIPKGAATRFSFLDFGSGPFLVGRLYAGAGWNDVHEARALFAPLTLEGTGNLTSDTVFMGKIFPANQKTDALFKFNSYRLTYRYSLLRDANYTLKVGVTGKVRDAEIRLKQGGTTASRKNVGVVPLLHVAGTYSIMDGIELIADVDALAAPQGRAEDLALLMGWDVASSAQVYGGYRTVEGGADGGGGVYNFTWINYAVAGLTWKF